MHFVIFLCTQHSAGVNCLAVLKSPGSDGCDYLFTGSRDGTLKRWRLMEDAATCSTTFESHVDWVLFASFLSFSVLMSLLRIVCYDKKSFDASFVTVVIW